MEFVPVVVNHGSAMGQKLGTPNFAQIGQSFEVTMKDHEESFSFWGSQCWPSSILWHLMCERSSKGLSLAVGHRFLLRRPPWCNVGSLHFVAVMGGIPHDYIIGLKKPYQNTLSGYKNLIGLYYRAIKTLFRGKGFMQSWWFSPSASCLPLDPWWKKYKEVAILGR